MIFLGCLNSIVTHYLLFTTMPNEHLANDKKTGLHPHFGHPYWCLYLNSTLVIVTLYLVNIMFDFSLLPTVCLVIFVPFCVFL